MDRRFALAASLSCLLARGNARAEEENQQIALAEQNEYIIAATPEEAHRRNVTTGRRLIHHGWIGYPRDKLELAEGWVRLETTILTDGTARDATIEKSYPKHEFDSAVMKAVPGFRFEPALVNGQPRETRGFRCDLHFMRTDLPRGEGSETYGLFRRLADAMRNAKAEEADALLENLRHIRDEGKFNLTELARFSDMSARIATGKHNFIEAHEDTRTTLALAQFLENDKVLQAVYELLLLLEINLGKFDQAVDFFDAYSKKYTPKLAVLAPAIAELRAKGFGKGVVYKPTHLAEVQKAVKDREKELTKG